MENENTQSGFQAVWNSSWYNSADEAQRAEFRDWFKTLLREQRVNVSFIKADGTERHMHCTLHADLIVGPYVEAGATRKTSDEAQSVWDLEAGAWRSFRWDRMQSFSFNLGELHVD
jgi:hypothetical protein